MERQIELSLKTMATKLSNQYEVSSRENLINRSICLSSNGEGRESSFSKLNSMQSTKSVEFAEYYFS